MKLLKKGAEADLYQTKWQNSKAVLKIRKIKKTDVDRIIEINNEINNLITVIEAPGKIDWELLEIEFNNFLSYGKYNKKKKYG